MGVVSATDGDFGASPATPFPSTLRNGGIAV